MSKYCPILKRKVNYLYCEDCDERKCEEIATTKERKERRKVKYDFLFEKEEKE